MALHFQGDAQAEPGYGHAHFPAADAHPPEGRPRQPYPQPVGKFQYLPENYSIPRITSTGNREATELVAGITEYFNATVLSARQRVDVHLKAFKASVNENHDAALPACFSSWQCQVFSDYEEDLKEGWFVLDPKMAATTEHFIEGIHANKRRDELSEDSLAIESHVNQLLNSCHEILNSEDEWKEELQIRIGQLSSTNLPLVEADSVCGELQQVAEMVGTFSEDITGLLKDIKAALVPVATRPGRHFATGSVIHRRHN